MNTWNPRKEILFAAHRWYWIVASFLVGACLGWLVSLIWPAPYRATQNLYVGLNAYRATRDLYVAQVAEEEFRNLDDYKNWQMGQLDAVALSDAYLGETLTLLLAEDPVYWTEYSLPDLRAMFSISWRNAGDWHFAAESKYADRAVQAVSAWVQVVTEQTQGSIEAARQVVEIDRDLGEVSQTLVAAESRKLAISATQELLENWETELVARPAEQPLVALDHWNLLSLVTTAADWTPGWQGALTAVPAPDSLPPDYLDWLSQVQALISAELTLLPKQISELQIQQTELSATYAVTADQSRAFSANLEVGQIAVAEPQVTHLRPLGSLLLVGGLLGVLAWGLGWLLQISRKGA